jgi:hypothetical protein
VLNARINAERVFSARMSSIGIVAVS